ncbi:MAG: hypothetical protein H0X25_17015 [Acidobacteriales bacterium]|nr:hypothetical protein [Terriglobales bacterium]
MNSEKESTSQAKQRESSPAVVQEAMQEGSLSELGEPLSIRQVARKLGCSPWTVRQTLIPQGLPHVRLQSGAGKLIFFDRQVVRWILSRQQREFGGLPK